MPGPNSSPAANVKGGHVAGKTALRRAGLQSGQHAYREVAEPTVPKSLAERIDDWASYDGKGLRLTDIDEKTKSDRGYYYHKPGSQNPNK